MPKRRQMDYKRPQIGFENRKQPSIYIRNERDEMIADSLMVVSKRPRKKYSRPKKPKSERDITHMLGVWRYPAFLGYIVEPSKILKNRFKVYKMDWTVPKLIGRREVRWYIQAFKDGGYVHTDKFTEYSPQKTYITAMCVEEIKAENRKYGTPLLNWLNE